MRLIDADKLPKYTGYALSASEVAKAVENAPTVDAVPVVRCRECKHADEYCHCSFANWWPDAMDYCSHGERKGGDE